MVLGVRSCLIDTETGEDRVIAKSDVQFGFVTGAPDGSRVAAVEAPCSDRQLVSGRAIVVEVGSGDSRVIEVEARGHHLARLAAGRSPRLRDPPSGRHRVRPHRPGDG